MGAFNNNPDFPKINRVTGAYNEFLLAKYDGVRASYAGCPKPAMYGAPYPFRAAPDGATGFIHKGTYSYAFVGKQVDAKGRVIYSEPLYAYDLVFSAIGGITFSFYCASAEYGIFGTGDGSTFLTNGAQGAVTAINVRVPHGVQPGDTLYFYQQIIGAVPQARSAAFLTGTNACEMLSREVLSVRGAVVNLSSAVTSTVDFQRFVANRTMLILRTRLGGAVPNFYLVAEIPYPELTYWEGYDNSAFNTYFSFRDELEDSALTEPFDLPTFGEEATRIRNGTAITMHGGRLCVARGGSLFWSRADAGRSSIEHSPLTNSIGIGGASGGKITSLCSAGDDVLYVFRKRGVYKVSGVFDDGNGIPTLLPAVVIEGDLGAANNAASMAFGGIVLAFGSGSFYAIRDGLVYTEIGKQINGEIKGTSYDSNKTPWRCYLSVSSSDEQIRAWICRDSLTLSVPSTGDLKTLDSRHYVLDLKRAGDNTESSDEIILSRSLFKGSWFRWGWKMGSPTSQGVTTLDGSEYSISNIVTNISLKDWVSGIYDTGPYATNRAQIQRMCGLWIRETLTSTNKFTDGSLSIRNMVNFTPIHKEQFDQEKAWVSFKLFRLIAESDTPYVTDWRGAVDLIFGLSNNYLTLDADILKLTSSVEFSNIKTTQAICPISGNYSPALEIKITVDELFKAIGFSSIILDYFEPFDAEGQRTTSKDF